MLIRRKILSALILILWILILYIYRRIFSLSPYSSIGNDGKVQSVAEFETSLCRNKKIKTNQSWESQQQCPKHGFVTVASGGRLGNQMWQYISVWGVARHTGLDAYIPRCISFELHNLFDSLTVPTLGVISECSVNTNEFSNSLEEWNHRHQSIMLKSNQFLARIALTSMGGVRKQFTIKKDLVTKSQKILHSFVKNGDYDVFVGVHVRRQDYISYLQHKYSIKPANVSFYYSAMKYYEDKYKNVAFIMVSDDSSWCKKTFKRKRNVFVVGSKFKTSVYLDFATLVACNHSIFDYGTYGGWAAMLTGGETIFYKIRSKLNIDLTDTLASLLPNWWGFT